MSLTEQALISAARQIGGIVDMAAWASDVLIARINASGKPVDELTIGELLGLLSDFRDHQAAWRRGDDQNEEL